MCVPETPKYGSQFRMVFFFNHNTKLGTRSRNSNETPWGPWSDFKVFKKRSASADILAKASSDQHPEVYKVHIHIYIYGPKQLEQGRGDILHYNEMN